MNNDYKISDKYMTIEGDINPDQLKIIQEIPFRTIPKSKVEAWIESVRQQLFKDIATEKINAANPIQKPSSK